MVQKIRKKLYFMLLIISQLQNIFYNIYTLLHR